MKTFSATITINEVITYANNPADDELKPATLTKQVDIPLPTTEAKINEYLWDFFENNSDDLQVKLDYKISLDGKINDKPVQGYITV